MLIACFRLSVVAIVVAGSLASAQTKTFYDVTGRDGDILDPNSVPNATVKQYLKELKFGDGEVGNVLRCEKCTERVHLQIASESGTVKLNAANLVPHGRLVALIRHKDLNPFHRQTDMGLNFYSQTAYIWLTGKEVQGRPGVYEAAIVRIHSDGSRGESVKGRVWQCIHPTFVQRPGDAKWKVAECPEPVPPGTQQVYNFHLSSWFPCDAGCCVFQDY
jgi:hypothetical protein